MNVLPFNYSGFNKELAIIKTHQVFQMTLEKANSERRNRDDFRKIEQGKMVVNDGIIIDGVFHVGFLCNAHATDGLQPQPTSTLTTQRIYEKLDNR